MINRVLVTGANGYIGYHLVKELLLYPDFFSVVVAGRTNPDIDHVDFVNFDLLKDAQSESLYADLGNPDICVHLAWENGFQHNALSHISHLSAHFDFLCNLAECGVDHFAVAGSFREYGSVNGKADADHLFVPDNLYTISKLALKNALEVYFKDRDICLQWFRPFTVYGDDERNNSIMSKIIRWEKEGKKSFPFTDGLEEYDYIHVDDLAKQICAIISQKEISGVIDCCSGKPTKLGDMIEKFISDNNYSIRPQYGVFPSREYDSKVIYGNRDKIDSIMKKCKLFMGD